MDIDIKHMNGGFLYSESNITILVERNLSKTSVGYTVMVFLNGKLVVNKLCLGFYSAPAIKEVMAQYMDYIYG